MIVQEYQKLPFIERHDAKIKHHYNLALEENEREKNFLQEVILQKKSYTFKHYFFYLLGAGCLTLLGVNN